MVGNDQHENQHAQAAGVPRQPIASTDLLRGENEIKIEHFAQIYRLRVTSTGKLILTK